MRKNVSLPRGRNSPGSILADRNISGTPPQALQDMRFPAHRRWAENTATESFGDPSLHFSQIPRGAIAHTPTAEIGPTAVSTVGQTLRSAGQPLDLATRCFMESRFGHDFSRVRVHSDEQAADAAESVGARAFTVAHHIVFGRREFAPSMLAGNRLLAHELTHVVQQSVHASRTAGVIQRAPSALESGTNSAERQNVRVLTSELIEMIPPDEVKTLMTDKGADSVPADAVLFGPGVTETIKRGLKNIAARIFNDKGFTFNTVTYLSMNLKPFGGANGVYRFALVRKQNSTKSALIIEQVSDTPPKDWHKVDLASEQKRFDSFGFKFGVGFESDDMKKRLFGALAHLSDKILARVRGLTFNKLMADVGDRSEAGHYDPNKHSIDFFGKSIHDAMNSADAEGDDWFSHVVMHEIGHALDDEAYTAARVKRDALAGQLKAAKLRVRQVKVDVNAPFPDEKAVAEKEKSDRQEIQQLQGDLNKAESDFDNVNVQGLSKSAEFGQARGKAISSYGEQGKNLEDFADLFSVFVLDPELLKSLRPAAFAYFSKKFPRE